MTALVLAARPEAAGLTASDLHAIEASMTASRGAPWIWSYRGDREEIARLPRGAIAALQTYARTIGAQTPHLCAHDPERGVFLPEAFDVPAGAPLVATSALHV